MRVTRVVLLIGGLGVIIGLYFLVASTQDAKQPATSQLNQPSSASPPSLVKSFNIQIKGRKLVEGAETITVNEGDTINLTVTLDESDELHLHGYNKTIELEPNKPATLSFKADISGRFEYELEGSKTEIGAIEVLPK